MKTIFLFCTKPWVYLTELPLMVMLFIAVALNDKSEELLKYYPLIIFLSLLIVFIAVYFFRMLSISFEEIRYHGLFSSKDQAFIKEKRTLVISVCPRHTLRLELFGDAAEEPAFDWMKAEDVMHREVCLFRGSAVGGKRNAEKTVAYFLAEGESAEGCLKDGYAYEDEAITVSTEQKNEITEIRISFKITVV